MLRILLLIVLFLPLSCSKSKTVLICGDHVCINKNEAKQYFEENLSLEVKIIDKKKEKSIDLVQLNLKENVDRKKISIIKKKKTDQPIKILTNNEINKIKKKIKNKEKQKKISSKKSIKNKKKLKVTTKENKNNKIRKFSKKIVNKNINETVDICTILEKCSIDEISNYLIKMGKNKRFPDITVRE